MSSLESWLRFREVVDLSPDGDAAAEAKRQLRRLARHARPDPPPAAVPALPDPACPTPSPPAAASTPAPRPARVSEIRHWSNPEYTRVVVNLEKETGFLSNLLEDRSGGGKPPRLYLDILNAQVEERLCRTIEVNDGILLGIRAGQFTPESVRIVLDIDRLRTFRVFPMQNPFRIVVDVTGGEAPRQDAEPTVVVGHLDGSLQDTVSRQGPARGDVLPGHRA